jgi:hypothetical protein
MSARLRPAHGVAALVLVLAGASAAWASSAGFELRGVGIDLGKAEEVHEGGKPLPPRFHVKAERGKPFTLIAQGMVYPRGAKGQPGEPDAGAWLFDDAAFKLVPHEKKGLDKTMVAVRLEPTAVGRTRVRFVGEVLGYYKTYDVIVDVAAAK